MLRRSKKGISPLIATVLLIAFAVALGAVVMNVSATLLESDANAQAADCTKLSLAAFKLRGSPGVCFGAGKVTYRITNTGSSRISDVLVQVAGERSVAQGNLESSLDPADIKDGSLDYSLARNGNIESVRFIPVAGTMACQAQTVEVVDVKDC